MNRTLGIVMIVVLLGVFSVVAYRKYSEARFQPVAGDSPAADGNTGSVTPPQQTGDPNDVFAALDGGERKSRDPAPAADPGRAAVAAPADRDASPFSDLESDKPAPTAAQPSSPWATNGANVASADPVKPAAEPAARTSSGQPAPAQSLPAQSVDGQTAEAPAPAAQPADARVQRVPIGASPQGDAEQPGSLQQDLAQSEPARPQADANGTPAERARPARTVQDPAGDEFGRTALLDERQQGPPAAGRDAMTPSGRAAMDPANAATADAAPLQGEPQESAESPSPRDALDPRPVANKPSTPAASADRIRAPRPRATDLGDEPFVEKPTGAGETFTAEKPTASSAKSTGNPGASAGGDNYVVQPQDNYWTISRKRYGTSRYFTALAELNKTTIPDPQRLRPGMKVATPPAEYLEAHLGAFLNGAPGGVQAAAEMDPAVKSGRTGFFVSPDGQPMYRTSGKDTLSGIAERHLGRASRWIQVYELNRNKLSSPNQLQVGTELLLPTDASNVALTSDEDDRR